MLVKKCPTCSTPIHPSRGACVAHATRCGTCQILRPRSRATCRNSGGDCAWFDPAHRVAFVNESTSSADEVAGELEGKITDGKSS